MPPTGYAPVSLRRCIVSNETRRRRSILKGREPRLGDLRVMLLGIRADADRPNHFTIHDDRESALHFDETTRGRGCDATIIDCILEILARLLEQGRRSGMGPFTRVIRGCPALRAPTNELGKSRR
jgi:hypothetical protein